MKYSSLLVLLVMSLACNGEMPASQIYPDFCILDLEHKNYGDLIANGHFPNDSTGEDLLASVTANHTKLVTDVTAIGLYPLSETSPYASRSCGQFGGSLWWEIRAKTISNEYISIAFTTGFLDRSASGELTAPIEIEPSESYSIQIYKMFPSMNERRTKAIKISDANGPLLAVNYGALPNSEADSIAVVPGDVYDKRKFCGSLIESREFVIANYGTTVSDVKADQYIWFDVGSFTYGFKGMQSAFYSHIHDKENCSQYSEKDNTFNWQLWRWRDNT